MVRLHYIIVVVSLNVFEGEKAAINPSSALFHKLHYLINTSSKVFIGSVRAIAFGTYFKM
jgi:hypothetical protein